MFSSITRTRNSLLFVVFFIPAHTLASLPPISHQECEPAHTIEYRLATGTCIYDANFDDCDGDDYEEDGCGHEVVETGVDGECVNVNHYSICTTMDQDGNRIKTVLLVHVGEEECHKPNATATECNCYVFQDWPPMLVNSFFDDCKTL